jgi:hypothetical protein
MVVFRMNLASPLSFLPRAQSHFRTPYFRNIVLSTRPLRHWHSHLQLRQTQPRYLRPRTLPPSFSPGEAFQFQPLASASLPLTKFFRRNVYRKPRGGLPLLFVVPQLVADPPEVNLSLVARASACALLIFPPAPLGPEAPVTSHQSRITTHHELPLNSFIRNVYKKHGGGGTQNFPAIHPQTRSRCLMLFRVSTVPG